MLRNTKDSYGWMAIGLHWLVAVVVIGLFALGLWMVDLGYYSHWYRTAPALHKAIGIVLFGIMAVRLLWRLTNPPPMPLPSHSGFERTAARSTHLMMIALLVAIMLSGYLISTAKGSGIDVFGLFSVPALIQDLPNQADIAGKLHLYLAVALISLAGLHALAALKHHFIDKDQTLTRMLGRKASASD